MQATTFPERVGPAGGLAERAAAHVRVMAARERSVPLCVALALAVAAVTGAMAVALQPSAAPLVPAGVLLFVLSLSWRRGVILMLLALPFSGVPVFMAGDAGQAMIDVALVLPMYAGFLVAITRDISRRDGQAALPRLGIALPALAVFAALVVLGTAAAEPAMVRAIGAKVWLAYVPMLAVGYRYVRRASDFDRVMRITAIVGLAPALLGICEWYYATQHADGVLLAWRNNFGPFGHLYGAQYEQVRVAAVAFTTTGHTFVIPRIPSTFPSVAQFYAFALVAFSAGLAQALRHGGLGWKLCAVVLGAGAVATGSRLSYVTVPLTAALALCVAGVGRRELMVVAAMATVGMAALLVWPTSMEILRLIPGHFVVQGRTAWDELAGSGPFHVFGHGTGWDTQAALKYGATGETRYIENWYAKAALEFGFFGLAAIAIVMASLSIRLLTSARRMAATERRLAAPVVAVLVVTVATLFKAPSIDWAPLNIYFWLLAGMVLALGRLPASFDEAGADVAGDGADGRAGEQAR
jgi:hypothetical protein